MYMKSVILDAFKRLCKVLRTFEDIDVTSATGARKRHTSPNRFYADFGYYGTCIIGAVVSKRHTCVI